jgi:hypothetical protein
MRESRPRVIDQIYHTFCICSNRLPSYNITMTNSLADLLANKWEEPAEMSTIKDFVRKKYNAQVSAPNAALAGTLRMNISELQKTLNTEKRLVIRIGS